MKKILLALVALAWLTFITWQSHAGTWCLATGATTCSTTTQVSVTILPGNICIASSGTFDFGSFTVSSSAQTVSSSFTATTGYFSVDDLRGSNSGYYTTIQLSGALTQSGGSGTIPAANVYMRATGGIVTLAGTANPRVSVHAGMSAFQSLDIARQLIVRPNQVNFGVLGQYATLPTMQLIIPAYQAVGTYNATMVYTLIEN